MARPFSRRSLARPGVGARLVIAVLAILLVAPALPAGADARSDQAEVRRKRLEAATRLDVLKASDQDVQQALDALDASVGDTTDQVGQAAQAERRAALEAESADRQLAAGEERLRAALGQLRGQAVHAYTTPAPGAIELSNTATAGDISRSLVYADVRIGRSADKLDEVRAARADLAAARSRAAKAAREAADRRATREANLADLEKLQAAQNSVANSLEAKVAANQSEVDSLAASDAVLTDAIARQDNEAAARRRAELLAQQAADADRLTRLRAAAADTSAGVAAVIAPPSIRPGIGGGVGGLLPPPTRPSTPTPPSRPVTTPAGPGLTTVRGITVSSSIAGQLASLLSASDSAGLSLGGGGYRSSQQQIQTRMNNCGTSQYAIYEMPASQCSPPTAKPGSSMHERGLAIDFTNRGSLISSRSNPAYQWLAGNAGRFGLRNLPSEPWHWSTNGN
ncbi:MAG: D-alanyl-D-alanine carboxypeptidase family protein [Acidimicrobiales bacterium]